MQITKHAWIKFIVISFLSFLAWFAYTYPQLAFVPSDVSRQTALTTAEEYLQDSGYEIKEFKKAITFSLDTAANQYLQKTIGFSGLKAFVEEHDFDMFLWLVRFFKEQEKEEFRLAVSAASGEVVSFKHVIEDAESREIVPKEEAHTAVVEFLKDKFQFDLEEYEVKGDFLTLKDNREDYSFSWRKKSVSIPWSEEEDSGTAKLLIGATISGNEILSFSKNTFMVPEKFSRHVSKLKNTGNNLSTIVVVLYTVLFVYAIYYILLKRNHLAMHLTKRFYVKIALFSFFLSLISNLNYFQEILFNYPTTSPMKDYFFRLIVSIVKNALFINFALLIPSLSGELLHYENYKDKKEGAFLYYVNTTFFSKQIASSIFLGYFVAIILMGLQSLMVEIGQRYAGVWVEYSLLGQMSTAFFPFIAAFTIGFKASIQEELMFRLFAISWGKHIFRSTFIAVLVSSLVWGFAHSGYPVYPMWFRGIEVTCLGIFLSMIYLKYGIIPVLVSHFLFDAFWSSSGYILGGNYNHYFYSSLAVLLLPLAWALIALVVNKKAEEKEMRWHLNKKQLFNLEVLKYYLEHHKEILENKTEQQAIKEVASNGWDIAVVELAMKDFYPQ